MKEQKLDEEIVSRLRQMSPEALARLKEKLKTVTPPCSFKLPNLATNLPEKEILRRKIYSAKLIDLVKTIEKETGELFGNLSEQDKLDLQNKMIAAAVAFTDKLPTVLSDVALDITQKILTQKKIKISDLTEQDIHRIIMVLSLRAYPFHEDKKVEKLRTLIKGMRLIE
jgi:hypothetical protein